MVWPVIFANLGGGNQPLGLFDQMFNQVAQVIAIPCNATGQNAISLTPIGNNPTLASGYTELCGFRFRAAQTSTGGLTAALTPFAFLPIYLSDGLTQAGVGNIQATQEYVLIFSAALNGGAGGFFLEQSAVPVAPPTAGGSFTGLTIKNNVGTPNTQIDIVLPEVVMNNTAGQSIRATGLTFTINAVNIGVINGLDVGALASNKQYYVWAISNGSIVGGLLSLSSTFAGLALPAGYLYGRRLGAWRTALGSAQFMGGQIFGTKFQYIVGVAQSTTGIAAITGVSGSPTVPTWTSVSLTANAGGLLVPPTAKSFDFFIQLAANAGPGSAVAAAPTAGYGGVASTTNPPPISLTGFQTAGAGINVSNPLTAKGTFTGSGPVFYANNLGGGLYVDGYDDNL